MGTPEDCFTHTQTQTYMCTHMRTYLFHTLEKIYLNPFYWMAFCLNIFGELLYFLFLPLERHSVRDKCRCRFVNLHQMPGVGFCGISKQGFVYLLAPCTQKLSKRYWAGIVCESQILSLLLLSYSFPKLISLRTCHASSPFSPVSLDALPMLCLSLTTLGVRHRLALKEELKRLLLRK